MNPERERVGAEVVVTAEGRIASAGSVDNGSGSASRGESIGDWGIGAKLLKILSNSESGRVHC